MKAIVQRAYGPASRVLELREIDVPPLRSNDVLVRVRAASVHPDIWHIVEGLPYVLRLFGNGLTKPKRLVPGTDLSGVIGLLKAMKPDVGTAAASSNEMLAGLCTNSFSWTAAYSAYAPPFHQPIGVDSPNTSSPTLKRVTLPSRAGAKRAGQRRRRLRRHARHSNREGEGRASDRRRSRR